MTRVSPAEAAALEAIGVPVVRDLKRSEKHMADLAALGYTFRVNAMDQSLEVNGEAITDYIAAQIRRDLRDMGYIRELAAVEDSYMVDGLSNQYHPLREYFKTLEWDGGDYIGALAAKLVTAGDSVDYADGGSLPLSTVYLYRWLVGVVGKCFAYQQNPMLILDAPQGLGKSQFVKWLCPLPQLFYEGPIDVHDKDALLRLMNKAVWEVSEVDATTRRADLAALKAFITTDVINVRRSYGRYDTRGHACCSFVGTVNNATGFLSDETGSRRFRVVKLAAIDWSYTAIDRDQLWAQAYALYNQGERSDLTDEEDRMRVDVNARYDIATPVDDWIAEWFSITGDEHDMLTSGQVLAHLSLQGHDLSGSERSQAVEISRILTRYGARAGLRRINGVVSRCWLGIVKKESNHDNQQIY